nr:auxilin-like protein [Tanacetum cinerariifolium]
MTGSEGDKGGSSVIDFLSPHYLHPYYLHPSNSPKQPSVNEVLTDGNYNDWAGEVTKFLFAKNKTDFVDETLKKPDTSSSEYKSWMNICVNFCSLIKDYVGRLRTWCQSVTVGQTALKAASYKVTKHEKACIENQPVFVPFAFDTFGFLAPEAVELLNRVQRLERQLSNMRTSDFNSAMSRFLEHTDKFGEISYEFVRIYLIDQKDTVPALRPDDFGVPIPSKVETDRSPRDYTPP